LWETDMASKLAEIEKAALSLPVAERAQLVTRLVASLGEEGDAEIELAWVEEAERRYQEAVEDPSVVEPAAAAFQRARNALR
jgi:putative addiction module component (TIGR02574 family)